MKIITLILITALFWTSSLFGFDTKDLRSGDVLLLSLHCYECRMIESETESLFSHSGVVVLNEQNELRVAQSLGRVALYTIKDFTKNITPGTYVHVYRAKEFKNLSPRKKTELSFTMLDVFNEQFAGAPFDSKYIWNNTNADGKELLYCSEFIAKFLDTFLKEKTNLSIISYSKHYDYWLKYFKGQVPMNELGNSPASFSRDHRFEFIGKF